MRIAIVSPFGSAAGEQNLEQWVSQWRRKDKHQNFLNNDGDSLGKVLKISGGDDPRKSVLSQFTEKDDTIYIVGHGSPGSPIIADKVASNAQGTTKLAASELADFVSKASFKRLGVETAGLGLPTSFPGRIKLLVCSGAAPDGMKKSFLERFVTIMRGYQYTSACIGGYTHTLFVGHRTSEVINDPVKHKYTQSPTVMRASNSREWFCASGFPQCTGAGTKCRKVLNDPVDDAQ